MNECGKYREMISAMLDGELDASQSEQLIAHLSSCAECRELYELLASVSGPEVWELPEVPEGLHKHIMSGVKKAASVRKKESIMRRFRPLAVAAACLVVIVGVIIGVPRVFRMGGSGNTSGAPESVFNTSSYAASNAAPAAAQDNAGTDTAAPETPADKADANQDEPVNGGSDGEFNYAGSTGQSGGPEAAPVPEPEAAPEENEGTEAVELNIDIERSIVSVERRGETISRELGRHDTLIWLRAIIVDYGSGFDAARLEVFRAEGENYEVYFYREDGKLMGSLSQELEDSIELKELADFARFEEMADGAKK